MRKHIFSRKFERIMSFVLAVMLIVSVFTANNVSAFAGTNEQSKQTETDNDTVNFYVKADFNPWIKAANGSEYKEMNKIDKDYYSFPVKKSMNSSTDDEANTAYQLAKDVEGIKTDVGELFTVTEDTLTAVNNNKLTMLKQSDIALKIGDNIFTDIGKSINYWEYDNPQLCLDRVVPDSFGELEFFYSINGTESGTESKTETEITDGMLSNIIENIKNKPVDFIVKFGNISFKTYSGVTVYSGLEINEVKWSFRTPDIDSFIDGNSIYLPTTYKDKEFMLSANATITSATLNGTNIENVGNIKITDSVINPANIKVTKDNRNNLNFSCTINKVEYDSQSYPIKSQNSFSTGASCYFVDVTIEKNDNQNTVIKNNTIYKKSDEECKYIFGSIETEIDLTNITVSSESKNITYDNDNDNKVLTIGNIEKITYFTVKYPKDNGFKVRTFTVVPDNDPPKVTKVYFEKKDSDTLTKNGLYSNQPIIMHIYLKDKGVGINPNNALVVNDVNCNEFTFNEETSEYEYTYTLGNSAQSYKPNFTTKDILGNENNVSLSDLIKNSKVFVGKNKITNENFNIVSYLNDDNFEFVNSIDNNSIVWGKSQTLTSTVSDTLSGIKEINNISYTFNETENLTDKVKINDAPVSDKYSYNNTMVENSFNLPTEESGKYVLKYTVINNCGVSKKNEITFYVDNTTPEITKVEFTKTSNPTVQDQFLNFLTFGIYSNDTIVMNVTATDTAPTSGFPSDAISVKDGNVEIDGTPDAADSSATDKSEVTYTYELDVSTSPYNLSFTVKDNAGNNKNVTLSKLIKDNKVTVDEKSLDDFTNIPELFEVVSTKANGFTFTDEFTGTDEKVYDAQDGDNKVIIRHGDEINVKSTVSIGDDLAGIYSIGEFKCIYYGEENSDRTPVEITKDGQSISSADGASESFSYSGNTKSTEMQLEYKIATKGSGKYELSYTATNNSGVSETNTKVFYVDNAAPEVTKVEFKKSENTVDKILRFLTFGIYSNDNIVVNVTATDTAPTSGLPLDAISVENGGTEIEVTSTAEDSNLTASATNESEVTYTYKLDVSTSPYNLSFTLKDNAGNSKNATLSELVKNNKVTVDEKSLDDFTNIPDSFEVVSTKANGFTFTDEFTGTDEKVYDAQDGDNKVIIRHGEEINVKSTVRIGDDLAGIYSIGEFKCIYYAENNSDGTPVEITKDGQSISSAYGVSKSFSYSGNTKSTEMQLEYKIATKGSGKYELSYTATNNSGISKTNTKVFYVDNTAPEVTKVEFKKSENTVDKILRFLTFGIYSNDNIVMNVTATDTAPTSGLPLDAISVENGGTEIEVTSTAEDSNLTASATNESEVTYTYNLGVSTSPYNLSFTAKDNAGNNKNVTLSELVKDNKVTVDEKSLDDFTNIPELFEVVSTKTNGFTFTDEFTGTDEKVYDAQDGNNVIIIRHGDEIKVKSTVRIGDDLAGIYSIGEFKCIYYAENYSDGTPVEITKDGQSISSADGASKSFSYSGNTKLTEMQLEYKIATKGSGKYELSYTATNNSGISKTNRQIFYVDNTAPVITSFTFKPQNETRDISSFVRTDYGYYFKNDTLVEVEAKDIGIDDAVSGISEIYFYTVERGKTGLSNEQTFTVNENENNKVRVETGFYFKVPANFKGNVYAYATDKAGNYYGNALTNNRVESAQKTPDGVIVENGDLHKQVSGIDINLPSTNYKEGSNNLYSSDVNIGLVISDSYSGISKIEYSVTSEFDTENNWNGSIEYDNRKNATTSINGNGAVSDWKMLSYDENLVTQVSSTITVKNNSNNIKVLVKLTDRAGNTSEETKYLSIDKTKPVIKVEYDNNNHTTHNGTEYYKANRTATITVTERNFNPDDIVYKITNTDNVIPQISNWTKHNVPSGENPDGTTYTATVVYSADGDYTFDISYADMAGNKADTVAQHKFTLDKTVPTISISFDNNSAKNSNYFKADRTATITVNEHNFNSLDVKVNISATGEDNSTSATPPSVSGWTSNGNVHTATIKFAKDGKYAFDVNYTDLADNAAKENVVTTFYVDKTVPYVSISNVENESANSGNVAPVINLSDNNYSGDYTLTLTRVDIQAKKTDVTNDFERTVVPTSNTGAVITYANFASEVVNDGIYVLNASLTDKAGNTSTDTITFSVNRFGSTYMGGNDDTVSLLDNGYTNAEKDIVISEINVDKLTKSNISLSLDSSSLKTLKQNVDYTIQEDAKTGQWHKYNYTVKASNFIDEGNYNLEFSSTDAAKNTSTNRIRPVENRKLAVQFVVDKTSPVVNIAGIESNTLYEENSKDVTVVCEDSYIDPSSLVIRLDDKTLTEGKDYTVEKDVAAITAKIKVNATSDISAQSVKVSVKDMAQNGGDSSVENFTLSATVLMRFFANPVLVIISAVILAAIIAMVMIIVARKRKN